MDGLIALALAKKYADSVGQSIISAGFRVQVEQDRSILETTGEEKVLYLLPKTSSNLSNDDGYDEFVYANNKWEWVGKTDVDLNYELLSNKPQINGVTLSGNKSNDDLSLQGKLIAGDNITIENGTISASGGVTSYTELENLPLITYYSGGNTYVSVPLTGTLNTGEYSQITKYSGRYSTRFDIDVNTQRVLTTEYVRNLNLNNEYGTPFIKSAKAQNVTNLPSFAQAKYDSDATLIQFAGKSISTGLQLLIWIDDSLTPHYAKRIYANNGFFTWEEINNGAIIVSGAINANGTITFTNSDGNTFTTTGSSVIGPQGDDYILTAQDKTDIADIVLSELPTTQGVLYGNTSN